jgi:hypothetical protein
MQGRLFSAWLVGAGLLLGVWGMIVFYGHMIGLSFPLFIGALIGTVLAFNAKQPSIRRNLWLVVPMLFFAIMVAVRADWNVIQANFLTVFALGALALYYMRSGHPADTASMLEHMGGTIAANFTIPFIGVKPILETRRWLAERLPQNQTPLLAVGRGILFALPVLIVFGVLLGSADAVFGQYVNDLWNSFRFFDSDDLIGRGITTLAIGWLAIGVLAYSIPVPQAQPQAVSTDEVIDEANPVVNTAPKRKPFFKLSLIEGGIVLGSVNLMFAAFVVIQFAYFFGGQVVEGLSYSEYARRGFFELVAVSVLTLGLVLALDGSTLRQSTRENQIFRALAILMVLLTGVMLVSAWRRMSIYEDAYGFTHLRIYTRIFMGWLGVMFGFFLLSLFRTRLNIFTLGILVSTIGFLATINLFNIDYYIAEQNINRYYAGEDFDVRFISYLSADALPPIIAFYETVDDPELRADLAQVLARQYDVLEREREIYNGDTFLSTNLTRNNAWTTLSQLNLPEYDYAYHLWSYSAYNYSRGD